MKVKLFLLFSIVILKAFSQKPEMVNFDPEKKYTQAFIDSLINDPEIHLRMSHYKKMLESDKSLLGWPHYYYGMSSILLNEKKYDSVLYYANKGIDSYENAKVKRPLDEKTLIVIYFFKGRALKKKKDSYNAIITLQKGLDLSKKHRYKWDSYVDFDIANTYMLLGNNDLALEYYLKTTKDSLLMTREVSEIYNNLGFIHDLKDNIDSSRFYYKSALKIALEKNKLDEALESYLGIGNLYRKRKKKDSAKYYYKQAFLNLNRDSVYNFDDELKRATLIHQFYSVLNSNSKKVIEELPVLIDSITITTRDRYTKRELGLLISANDYLSQAYTSEGSFLKAIEVVKKNNNFLSDFNDQIQNEKIEQLEIQYQIKEKNAFIVQLEGSKQQQETIIKQQKTIAFGLGGLLLLFLLSGILFWKQRKLKNQYEKENLEQRLLRSQMNPHFVFNALNSVAGLVQKKSEQTIPYINKLAALFRLILTNSREEFVSLEDELAIVKNYLELQSNFSKDFDFEIKVDNSIDKESLIIPPMLIQPFIENAIVHGLSNKNIRGNIQVHIEKQQHEDLLFFKISDNGIGYTVNPDRKIKKKYKSISGDIVTERLAILKKKFKVNTRFNILSKLNSGTSIELYLPYLID